MPLLPAIEKEAGMSQPVTPPPAAPAAAPSTPHGAKRVEFEAKRLAMVVVVAAVTMWPPLVVGRILLGPMALTMLLFGSLEIGRAHV